MGNLKNNVFGEPFNNDNEKRGPISLSVLGDKEIRASLLHRLKHAKNSPKAILEELRVHNGNAIADVVAIYADAHCYEIKSDKDSIERVQKQAKFYDLVFRKITLVTTDRHAARAVTFAPEHWGIIIVKNSQGNITFSYKRAAGINKNFNKQLALLTLWRSELTTLAESVSSINLTKISRKGLTEIVAKNLSELKVSHDISKQLIFRSQK